MALLAHHAHVFPESIDPDGTIDRLLPMLDTCGIDQAVCFAPFAHQCDGRGIDPNPWLAGELKKHTDRLQGFGTIDTRREDVSDQALWAGQGSDGNRFQFSGDRWRFNLKVGNYSAPGTYVISMISGDAAEYRVDPSCEAEFVVNP